MKHTNFFIRLGRLLSAWPKTALALILLELLALGSQLPKLEIDTSVERFLRPDSKAIKDYDKFRKEFGRDEFFVIAVTGEKVLTLDYLTVLREFHEELERSVDYLQSVESLVNVRSIYGDGDDLIAEELLENMPQNADDLSVLIQRVRNKPVYYGRLINQDEDATTLLVKLLPYVPVIKPDGTQVMHNLADEEMFAVYNHLLDVAAIYEKRFGDNAQILIGGTPASGSYMSVVIRDDFSKFTSVALLMIIGFLWIMFRRLSGVLLPVIVMGVGIVSTLSLLPIMGYPMQVTTSIIPSFLLAVCIGDSVHLLHAFYRHYDTGNSKLSSILYAMGHTGVPILFTSITTAAGLISFSFSDILPIASLGLFSAIGSVMAFVITVLLLPVLLQLTPIKRREQTVDSDKMKEGGLLHHFVTLCVHASVNYPKTLVGIALLLLSATLVIIPKLQFSQDSLEWFEDGTPVKQAIKTIEAKITGSMPVEVVIDTGVEQGVVDPQFLQQLDRWLTGLEGSKINGVPIMSVNSITTLIKETHQAFNGNGADMYVIPDNRELIAQELLTVEMDKADDLYEFTDRQFRKTRLTLIVPWADAILFADFLDQLEQGYTQQVGTAYPMHMTGVVPIFATMFAAMIQSTAVSYMIAAVVISIMMVILMRNLVDGLLSMIPNLLPVLMMISMMVLTGLPMDLFTMLLGSIALGLSIDDTVHFMHGFKHFYRQHGDAAKAVEQTLMSTGKAMTVTTIVLFFGFMTYTLSGLQNMDNFGILTASCIILAYFADFLIAPALMVLRYGKKQPKPE